MFLQAGWLSVEVRDFSLGWVIFCVLFLLLLLLLLFGEVFKRLVTSHNENLK